MIDITKRYTAAGEEVKNLQELNGYLVGTISKRIMIWDKQGYIRYEYVTAPNNEIHWINDRDLTPIKEKTRIQTVRWFAITEDGKTSPLLERTNQVVEYMSLYFTGKPYTMLSTTIDVEISAKV